MAKIRLTIRLDEEREAWRPGEVVRGRVRVETGDEIDCRALTVALGWRTRSKGSSVRRLAVTATPFEGTWPAGVDRGYAFALEIPPGPFTYRGHHLQVVWEIVARADLALKIDPTAEHEIVVEADPEAEPDWQRAVGDPLLWVDDTATARDSTPKPVEPRKSIVRRIRGLGCLLLVVGPALFLFFLAIRRIVGFAQGEIPREQGLVWIVVAAVIVAFFGGGVLKVARDLLAHRKLGKVAFDVEPRRLRGGQSVRVRLTGKPRSRAELLSATIRLEAEEQVTFGSTENRRGQKKIVHEQDLELAAKGALEPGMPFTFEGEIEIPQGAPPSFVATDNRVNWTLRARLDLERWPDWVEERTLQVHP